MSTPELQGEDRGLQPVVQQTPKPRMVVGLRSGELLHVGSVVSERLAVERLEMGGGVTRVKSSMA